MASWGSPNWGDVQWQQGTPASSTGSPPVITVFTVTPSTSTAGALLTLAWSVTNAVTLSISPVVGEVTGSSITTTTPLTTTTYTLTAVNGIGADTATATVTISGPAGNNVRYSQIRANDRKGPGAQLQMYGGQGSVPNWPAIYDIDGNINGRQPRGNTSVAQMADQAAGFISGDLLGFDSFGNARDSGISADSVLTGSGLGSWYGQIPRGAVNGVNTSFTLDYAPTSPYTILSVNGLNLIPQPDGPNLLPNAQYVVTGNDVVMSFAPKITDWFYIWYFRAATGVSIPPPPAVLVASAALTVWTSFAGGSSTHGFASITFFYPSSIGGNIGVSSNSSAYALVQTNKPLTTHAGATNTYFSGATVQFSINGSLLSIGDPNFFKIYDVYITLTMADTSVQIVRPTTYGFFAGGNTFQQSWQPNHNYGAGATVVGSNGNVQLATVGGLSGSSNPIWTGTTTTDGTVTWLDQGAQTSTTGQITNPFNAFDPDTTPPATFATFEQSTWGGLVTGGNFTVIF